MKEDNQSVLSEMKAAKGYHPLFCKWWMRIRYLSGEPHAPGGALAEFYVPFWAWPFELLHRLIFGKSKLQKLPEIE